MLKLPLFLLFVHYAASCPPCLINSMVRPQRPLLSVLEPLLYKSCGDTCSKQMNHASTTNSSLLVPKGVCISHAKHDFRAKHQKISSDDPVCFTYIKFDVDNGKKDTQDMYFDALEENRTPG
jgi:hypothetical protein